MAELFCGRCGAKHERQDEGLPVRYFDLVARPEVRERILMASRRAKKSMSGEDFLATFSKLAGVGVPIDKIISLIQPLYSKLGIATGKEQSQRFAGALTEVVIAALCALAAGGHELRDVHQASDGCAFEASVPSDLFSFAGTLVVTVAGQAGAVGVTAATKIPGQLFDWGKSRRALSAFFDELRRELARDAGQAGA